MTNSTYKRDDERVSNTRRLRVNFTGDEAAAIRAVYKASGKPEPEEGSTLGHNPLIFDWLRTVVLNGEAPDVSVDPPAATSDYLPADIEVTEAQALTLRESIDSPDDRRESFRGNGPSAQAFRAAVKTWLDGVVKE